ncbi:MAG: 3-isopropylmalate dehydratase small subunit [Rhodospirillaceae bacterium]|nr:3-isopropylmalate dehydratase small subunit [Rhodospirillaceae bacterium]|tara:strand:- start:6173 stop:6796 length:624 start_codon:yes stop_codon:yes gene_type:complete
MEPFTCFTAVAAPMDQDNIDTDQILPARHLMMPRDERYGGYVFKDLRLDNDGNEIETFVLNKAGFRESRIIVAGHNFGCGSSREGAVFTLVDAGFRAIIATSFGDIFYNNSFNNGLLPVTLPDETVLKLRQQLREGPRAEISVDLEAQTVTGPDQAVYHFEIDAHRRHRLLNGLDAVGYTLQHEHEITKFEERYSASTPWEASAKVS